MVMIDHETVFDDIWKQRHIRSNVDVDDTSLELSDSLQ